MGSGYGNNSSCTYSIGRMKQKLNFWICVVCVFLYIVNQKLKFQYTNKILRDFFIGYYNDVIAGILITAYANLASFIFRNGKILFKNLMQILLFVLACGLFWEYISPIYRQDQVSDVMDIFAYLIGGIIYWLITKYVYGKLT